MESCVVLVTNHRYLRRCLHTVWQLRTWGQYSGDITILIGDDLAEKSDRMESSFLRFRVTHFADLPMDDHLAQLSGRRGLGGMEKKKLFQYHKFHLFAPAFKGYGKILYVDAGMRVMHPILKILALDCENKIIAHSDAFPDFRTTLESQFNFLDFPKTEGKLRKLVPGESDYFQTSMMLFDPTIVGEHTVDQLEKLRQEFPNSKTNDQGIINLWALANELWTPLPTQPEEDSGLHFYDFFERGDRSPRDYIMLKYPRKPLRKRDQLSDALFSLYWKIFSHKLDS